MISIRQVSKVYANGVRALSNLNLEVKQGEFVFVTGPSGAGKSTLMKLLYRAETPTMGQVIISGVDLGRLPPRNLPQLRQRIGVVFQDYKLLADRSVYENVAFALKIIGTAKAELHHRVRSSLDLVGLRDFADAKPGELSGGQQQRVCLARAIVNTPPLLIADEPTGNLDPETSWEIMRLLTKINLHGTTVVVATHNKLVVDNMRRRVLTIDGGKLVQDQARGVYSIGVN
ncbi:MAG: cell division ATP-binding protein FtsE [Candidatus Sericytochromatia bacterium]|nr:cell division ATP-binding protein FtsE [Candidatus Sericytochromatia bacterium]